MARWQIVSGGGAVAKRNSKHGKKDDKPMTRVQVRKALKAELDRQIKELSPAERGELVKALAKRRAHGISEQVSLIAASKGRDDELEPGDRGGGVAAIEVETAYGERRRLDKEAGDPTKHVRKGRGYGDALVRQKPTRTPRWARRNVSRLLDD
ncbi:MAG: hypothetical protein ACRDPP_00095 [Gaiellaceae bacterium]